MPSTLPLCPRCGAANEPSAARCQRCGQPLRAELAAVEGDPGPPVVAVERSPRTVARRAVVAGVTAGVVATLGGTAFLAYLLTQRERFDQVPRLLTYAGHEFTQEAAWSPDGARVASIGAPQGVGSEPATVHVWDATTGKRQLICTLEDAARGRWPAGIVWSADGGSLLAVVVGPARDAIDRVQVWDAATGQRARSMAVARTATGWAMNDRYLAVARKETQQQAAAARGAFVGAMGAMIPSTPPPPATPTAPPTPTPGPSPTVQSTATTTLPTQVPSAPNVIEIWDLATGKVVGTLHPDAAAAESTVEALAWAPTSGKLAVYTIATSPGHIRVAWTIWDAPAGKPLQSIEFVSGDYEVLAWSRDGESLALGAGVTDAATGRRMASYRADGFLYTQAWAPDGRHIAVWVRAGTGLYSTKYDVITIIEAASGRQVAVYNAGKSEVGIVPRVSPSPLAWSPDGTRLLVVRKGVEIWRPGLG